MLDPRGQLLRAALGFAGCSMPSYDRALWALRTWLDSWSGVGHVAVGMHRPGYDLQLTQYDERGWRATFYTTGLEHSPTSATGTAWERTPSHAAGGVGGAQPRERRTTLRNLLARLTRGTRFWRRTEWVLYRIVRDGSQE